MCYLANPLYQLLRKGHKFEWGEEQSKVMRRLKDFLYSPLALKKIEYYMVNNMIDSSS